MLMMKNTQASRMLQRLVGFRPSKPHVDIPTYLPIVCLKKQACCKKRPPIEIEQGNLTKRELLDIPVLSIKASLEELDGFQRKRVVIYSKELRRKALPEP